MKKVLSIALVLIMMASAIVTISAAVPYGGLNSADIDLRYLEEYGQDHHNIGAPTTSAPDSTDGTINEGEYAYSFEMKYGEDPNVFKCVEGYTQSATNESVQNGTMYVSYDDNLMYFGYTRKDTSITYTATEAPMSNGDGITLMLNSDGENSLYGSLSRVRIHTSIKNDTGELYVYTTFFDFEPNGTYTAAGLLINAREMVPRSSAKYDADTQMLTIEFAVSRPAYEARWGCDHDEPILFRLDSEDWNGTTLENATTYGIKYPVIDPLGDLRLKFMQAYPDAAVWWDWGPNVIRLDHAHVHNVTDEWNYNDNYHYKSCSCGLKDKESEAKHVLGTEGVITKEPTIYTKGEITFKCVSCDYTEVEKIDKLDPSQTQPQATNPPATEPVSGGCGGAMALAALAVVPALAVAFVAKKKED